MGTSECNSMVASKGMNLYLTQQVNPELLLLVPNRVFQRYAIRPVKDVRKSTQSWKVRLRWKLEFQWTVLLDFEFVLPKMQKMLNMVFANRLLSLWTFSFIATNAFLASYNCNLLLCFGHRSEIFDEPSFDNWVDRNATVRNLQYAGYSNWERLILRGDADQGKPAVIYKSEKRKEIEDEGYIIRGNSGDQWSDLLGFAVAQRSFKLPNPLYYVA
ncbi:Acid phosphatase 1 [Sesamum angolense]|uniref:Acid phosphatase 1 n=1 Tax=Sesamum angolense TaxID=2727404 RepID=A0AAE2BNG9_9LAMI|nr:Acid phosphatase 1 [Sesamum angolense]